MQLKPNQQQLTTYLKWSISIYIVSTGFLWMPSLPVVGDKLQLQEIIFLCLILPILILVSLNWRRFNMNLLKINLLDKGIFCYVFGLTLATILGNHTTSIIQLGAIFYLTLVAVAIKYLMNRGSDLLEIDNYLINAFKILGIWLSVIAIGGWCMWYLGLSSALVRELDGYIYFGACARALATAKDANMLASILVFSIAVSFLSSYYRGNLRSNVLPLMLMSVALLLTMSKAILLLSVIPFIVGKPNRWVTRIFTGFTVFLLLWVTHFYTTQQPLDLQKMNHSGSFVCTPPVLQIGKWTIYPTSYFNNKKISYKAFKNNPLYGIGLDQQEKYAAQLQKRGEYPIYFSPLDSHCTYTGAFAEGGILGGLGFLSLILCGLVVGRRVLLHTQFIDNQFVIGIIAVTLLSIAAVESWTLETNTFRHYWVALGILSGYLDRIPSKNKNDDWQEKEA